MEKGELAQGDSDSGKSPVAGEKTHHLPLEAIPDPDDGLSAEERAKIDRKLLWKLDLKLIPWLCLLYLASFLDRTNIGNAKIAGLSQDLKLTNSQYNLTLTIFFISYAGFEPLTQILLKRFRPSIFIPVIMVLWGVELNKGDSTHLIPLFVSACSFQTLLPVANRPENYMR